MENNIKTFEDACKAVGISVEEFEAAATASGLELDELNYRKLKIITKALNEGWEPDWSNFDECKYYPWFRMGVVSGSGSGFSAYVYDYAYSHSSVGSRLVFKSRDLAKYAGQQFEDIYKGFFLIN